MTSSSSFRPNAALLSEPCGLPARELASLLASKQISARELLEAFVARIEDVNPAVNALVSLDFDAAQSTALAIDEARSRGEPLPPHAGLPIAIKDTHATRGLRSTQGSPIFADLVPETDCLLAERLRGQGLVFLGKSNVPEFALGSHTFNPIFGATRNPWDLSLSAGGSSGGAAAAVATAMLPFADGSDLGGSLRNPASFCGVVGLRPSPGVVPVGPGQNDLWFPYAVGGPIARTADDAAFLLQLQAGFDARDPLTGHSFSTTQPAALDRDFRGLRIAWSPDLGDLPIEPAVRQTLTNALSRFMDLGCIVEEVRPDFAGADEAFHVLRAAHLANKLGPLLATHGHAIKATGRWNIEAGLNLTLAQVFEAQRTATRIFRQMQALLEQYDFLLCPACQVLPFPVESEYPTLIDGQPQETYLEWMRIASRISLTLHPSASAPVAHSSNGLPVGMQIIGRYRDELSVLQLCHAVELPLSQRTPRLFSPHSTV